MSTQRYLILLRGINVGGKNKVPMAELRGYLEQLGFSDVISYINSGNVILASDKQPAAIQHEIETMLPKKFKLDSELIKILVLSRDQLEVVLKKKPRGFGEQPKKYYSDVIFLMDVPAADAMLIFDPREGVDMIWPGSEVIYSQRLGEQRTKSRLSKIVASPLYKSMTIRTWGTVEKLFELLGG